jgi:hypothetical protein
VDELRGQPSGLRRLTCVPVAPWSSVTVLGQRRRPGRREGDLMAHGHGHGRRSASRVDGAP